MSSRRRALAAAIDLPIVAPPTIAGRITDVSCSSAALPPRRSFFATSQKCGRVTGMEGVWHCLK